MPLLARITIEDQENPPQEDDFIAVVRDEELIAQTVHNIRLNKDDELDQEHDVGPVATSVRDA